MYRVTQCCCMDRSFADWLAAKEAGGWSMEEAAGRTDCGECCGMCKPYLAVVAATGITVLPVLDEADMPAFIERHRR